VSVIDPASNAVVASVPVGLFPRDVAIRPDGLFAYVANNGSNTVSVINTLTSRVVATVSVGIAPTFVAMRPDGVFFYVANDGSGTISVIRTATNSLVSTLPISSGPSQIHKLILTPDGAFAYVASEGLVSIIETSTNTVKAKIPVNITPLDMIISPNGAFAYVAGRETPFEGGVYVISTATQSVVNVIPGISDGLAITPDNAFLYVLSTGGDVGDSVEVSVIDTTSNSPVADVDLGTNVPSPIGMVITPDGSFVVLAYPGFLKVISTATNTVVGTVPINIARFTPDKAFAFISQPFRSQNYTMVNVEANNVVGNVPFLLGPNSAAMTPDISWAYQDIQARTMVSKSGFTPAIFPQVFLQLVAVRNNSTQPIAGPITITINNLQNAIFLGNSLRSTVTPGPDNVFSPGEIVTFPLTFFSTSPGSITYTERVLAAASAP
jgi:YVTN family beta-propeller protein